MRATITGATGLLGGNLAIELCRQGWEVIATKRASSKTSHLDEFDIEWVDASLTDVDSLIAAFRGADVVFHCAAAVSVRMEVEDWIYEANVVGTNCVIDAVREVGARLVHCSSVVAIGVSSDGEPCTEANRWNLPEVGLDDAYAKTKYESQQNVLAAAKDGLDAVIVNPTYMFGPYDVKPSSGKLVREIALGKMPGYTLGTNNFVDVRDVARGMVLAAERGTRGEMYILGGVDMTYKEVAELVAKVAGVPAPKRRVPHAAAVVVGWLGDLQSKLTGNEPLLNSATIRWSECDRYLFSSAKASRELGYEISPLEPAITACLQWFRDHQIL